MSELCVVVVVVVDVVDVARNIGPTCVLRTLLDVLLQEEHTNRPTESKTFFFLKTANPIQQREPDPKQQRPEQHRRPCLHTQRRKGSQSRAVTSTPNFHRQKSQTHLSQPCKARHTMKPKSHTVNANSPGLQGEKVKTDTFPTTTEPIPTHYCH